MNRIQEKYNQEVVPAMMQKYGYKNKMAVPRIVKITLNSGIGKYREDKNAIEEIEKDLTMIAGQKAVSTRAKKAISSFKTRIGQVVGVRVTLRGAKMYDFIDRLVSLALPRTRDFRGLSAKAIDQKGDLTVGIKEQIIFPEISHENVRTIFGFQVCLTTTAKTKEEGLELYKLLGFPIKD